eukprot:scaffold23594_cov53-Phaeocystis_antarctica.AAC.2
MPSRTVEHRFGLAARFLTSQRDGCGWCCGCGGRGGGSSGSSTLLCKQLGERAHANAVRHPRHRRSSANRTRDRRFLPPLHTVCGGDPQEQHDHAVRHPESILGCYVYYCPRVGSLSALRSVGRDRAGPPEPARLRRALRSRTRRAPSPVA